MALAGRSATSTRQQTLWRQRWLQLHLWLGLMLGLVFVLFGLTGSALVFYREIDGWLNPAVVVGREERAEHDLESVFAAITAAHPGRTRGWRLEVPSGANRVYTARYYYPVETQGKSFAPLLVTADPYSLEIRASRFWGRFAMTFIYDLHYTLLLGAAGATVVALVGLGLLASLLSGLYLWWPTWASVSSALRWKARAGSIRRTYDIHKLSGVYGLVLTLALALTGVMLAKPAWFNPVLQRIAPITAVATPRSQVPAEAGRITMDEAARLAQQVFPEGRLRWIETPDGAEGVYRLRMQQPGEPSARFPQSYVWLDQYDGRVLATRDARKNSISDSILAWLHPLHNGEAFGSAGRWLAFAAGLLPAVLFVTGLIRWRQKENAKKLIRLRASSRSVGRLQP